MIAIREYTEPDREALISLITLLQDFENQLEQDRFPGNQVAKDYLAFILKTCAQRNGKILIAVDDSSAIGFVSGWIVEDQEEIISKIKRYGYISDLIVSPDFRRQNIGRLLINSLEKYFKDAGLETVKINTLSKNLNMLTFLNKLGYRQHEITSVKEI